MLAGTSEIPLRRGVEYASYIVEAMYLDRPTTIYGNVRNTGLISNLPDGCVEVACLVDRNSVQPCYFGPLPEQVAALDRAHMAVHTLVVEALLHGDQQAARYALQLDPLTAAVCSPAEIDAMFTEMWEAERDYLPVFE
jgi:alpha-galactosidase